MEYLNNVYLLIGGNVGDRMFYLSQAIELLQKHCGNLVLRSSVYETAPWGIKQQDLFLNQALKMQTRYQPKELMKLLLEIEKEMGRIRKHKYGPRIIDLDILFFNEAVINTTELTIPHQEIQNRRFVLQPLADIAPLLVHPVLNKSVQQLLQECSDHSEVKPVETN